MKATTHQDPAAVMIPLATPPIRPPRRGFKMSRSRPSPLHRAKAAPPVARRLFTECTTTAAANSPADDDPSANNPEETIGAALESLRKAVLAARAEAFKKRWAFDILADKPVPDGEWVYTRLA